MVSADTEPFSSSRTRGADDPPEAEEEGGVREGV